MTKTLLAGMTTHLALDTTTLATCIQLTLENGNIFRFTDHPANIIFASNTYLSSVGHEASDPIARNTLSVDGLEMTLLIDNPGLKEVDLLAGLYDYADFILFMVDYTDPDTNGDIKIMKGKLGEVATSKGITATVELRGLTQNLQKAIGEKYSADCPVELTDARCGVNVNPTAWATNSAQIIGDRVSPVTGNGRKFIAIRAGATGDTEPTWNTVIGGTTTETPITGTTTDVANSTTTGAPSATVLIDSTATFQAFGVTAGDVIRNVTDGSAGTVASIQSEIQVTTSALTGGVDQTWETGDTYSVDLAVTINDSTATFITDAIPTGVTLQNISDSSSGTVSAVVSETKITTSAMTGGTINAFAVGDSYSIDGAQWTTENGLTKGGTVNGVTDRQTFQADLTGIVGSGTTTGGSSTTVLIDSTATFQTNNAAIGDTVGNVTDASIGVVVSVDSEIQLTTSLLVSGTDNLWDTGDTYGVYEKRATIIGTHTGASEQTTTLDDTAASFITTSGVFTGDFIQNTTDGSAAKISLVFSDIEIQNEPLTGGTDNDWDTGDAYIIHRQLNGTGHWQYGIITWVTGANAGLSMEVKTNTQTGGFVLFLQMAFVISVGDTFSVEVGCDKLFSTCKAKFNNVINFQGFPYVPGPDTLMTVGGQ